MPVLKKIREITSKKRLTVEEAGNMSIVELYRYYFPKATVEEIDFFFWECTPFPFGGVEQWVEALFKKYKNTIDSLGL